MGRNFSPALLKTLHGFCGDAQQPRQLALALSQVLADLKEFFLFHSPNNTTKWLLRGTAFVTRIGHGSRPSVVQRLIAKTTDWHQKTLD